MIVELGKKYRDVVTGFEWIATALTTFLTGCDRVHLTASYNNKEGKEGDTCSFDVNSIELVGDWVVSFFRKETGSPKESTEIKVWWPELYKSKTIY